MVFSDKREEIEVLVRGIRKAAMKCRESDFH